MPQVIAGSGMGTPGTPPPPGDAGTATNQPVPPGVGTPGTPPPPADARPATNQPAPAGVGTPGTPPPPADSGTASSQPAPAGVGTPGTPPPPSGEGSSGIQPVAAAIGTEGPPPPDEDDRPLEEEKDGAPDTKSGGSATPTAPPTPKRGALPTPKEDIQNAPPYVPEKDQTAGHNPTETVSRTNPEKKDGNRENSKTPKPK